VAIFKCGCMLSEKLIQNLKNDELNCPACNEKYNENDVISLNMTVDE